LKNSSQLTGRETSGQMTDPEIPDGWVNTTIGVVADLSPPKPSQKALPPSASVTFVPMPAVDAEMGAIVSPKTRAFASVRKGYSSFAENDIIFAKITPCMENGKVAIARNLSNGLGFGSTEFLVLRSKGAILPEYLFYYLRQEWFRRTAEAEMTGSVGQRRVPAGFLRNAPLPLAPEAEQKRIVAKAEELLARVNATKERLAKVTVILKRFRQAVLAAAYSGQLTAEWRDNQKQLTDVEQWIRDIFRLRQEFPRKENGLLKNYTPPNDNDFPPPPKGWTVASSDVLFSFVTSGSRGWAKYYADSGSIFIRIANLDHNSIHLTLSDIQHVTPPSGAERNRTRVQPGDILISITADVGMTALVPDEFGEAYVNQHVAIARPIQGVYKPYLAWYLASSGGQAQFQDLQRGATKIGLGLDDIKSLVIPFPPLEEQQEIVRRVEALFKLADSIEKRVTRGTARAESLTQAILAKAFRGELVPPEAELARREGRSYEPASALLARIKAELAEKGTNLKPAGRSALKSHPKKVLTKSIN